MGDAHRRKKQPGLTRQQLLDVAAGLALESGVGALTLNAVAKAAGVSKGGLLHHFPSKRALLEGLCDDLVARFGRDVARRAARDADGHGRGARAYLHATAVRRGDGVAKLWGLVAVAAMFEPGLRDRWRDWMADHARPDADGGADPAALAVVRLAADGLWMADLFGVFDKAPRRRAAVVRRLEAMTKRASDRGAGA